MITEDATISVAEGLSRAELDGEVIILDVASGRYYGVNSIGGRILELAEEPRSVSEILDQIGKQYNVSRDQIKRDVLAFLGDMVDNQLVQLKA